LPANGRAFKEEPMSLNIEDPEAHRLAQAIARRIERWLPVVDRRAGLPPSGNNLP
jgi:hypothetical protein